jgi:hypothetical protein
VSAFAKHHQLREDLLVIIAASKSSLSSPGADTPTRFPRRLRYQKIAPIHECETSSCTVSHVMVMSPQVSCLFFKAVLGETYRRVGVCRASSTPPRPPGHYIRVEKQSYLPRRRYANTPTRRHASPLRRGKCRMDLNLQRARKCLDV